MPAVNQIELHPRLQQSVLRGFHGRHGIVTEAWSPLAKGQLLEDATLSAIATAHGRSTAQVILRWHLQLRTFARGYGQAERPPRGAGVAAEDVLAAVARTTTRSS